MLVARALAEAVAPSLLAGCRAAPGQPLWQALLQQQQQRCMAILVDVKENNVDAAWRRLQRDAKAEGMPKEVRRQQHFLNGSQQRFEREKREYGREVGRIINSRIRWLAIRKKVK